MRVLALVTDGFGGFGGIGRVPWDGDQISGVAGEGSRNGESLLGSVE